MLAKPKQDFEFKIKDKQFGTFDFL